VPDLLTFADEKKMIGGTQGRALFGAHKSLTNKSSAVAQVGERLATIDMGRKRGLLCSFRSGGGGSPSNTMWQMGRGLSPYTNWNFDPSSRLATIGTENWGLCPLGKGLGPNPTQCRLGRGLPTY